MLFATQSATTGLAASACASLSQALYEMISFPLAMTA